MKTCPECGTQYEDHVPSCLVDGADLTSISALPSHSGPAPYVVAVAPPPPPPPAARSVVGGGMLLGLAGMFGVGFVAVLVAIGGVVWFGASDPEPPKKPEVPVAAPQPAPVPVPVPVAGPVAVAPAPKISIRSDPAGAELWEGAARLCTTPCSTDHPDHAPLPRTFTLKLAGYLDTTYEMTDPAAAHDVRMRRPVPQQQPQPNPRVPKINVER